MQVQSVLVPRKHFLKKSAQAWVRRHGYLVLKIDTTTNYYRFRQLIPDPNKKYITKKLTNGVKLVISR